MEFGYVAPNYGGRIRPSELFEIAELCEELGFDSVWATDHIIMPKDLKDPYGEVLEPFVTLASIGARTEKLKLGTSIVVLPQRNPILLAKQAATLDNFSNGRVILGLGAGWAQGEFANLGASFVDRGRVYDESLRLIEALWGENPVSFAGKYFNLAESIFLPKPVHGRIPVWIGGTSAAAVGRAIRLGDGWHPVGLGLKDFSDGAQRIKSSGRNITISLRIAVDMRTRDTGAEAGGERRAILSGTREEILSQLHAYEEAGLDYLCASILHPATEDIKADIRKFSSEVMASFS